MISAQPPSGEPALDAVVIGGGFFGCETALELKRLGFSQILVVEREPGLLRRASFVNQARVHNGYHYPRAPATALRSRKSFERFVADYSDVIVRDLKKYYAIARGSAMECAAVLDALSVLKGIDAGTQQRGGELLERVVAMLTKMCR